MKDVNKLLNENSFFKTLFDSIPLGVMLVNPDGLVERVNDFMQQTFSISHATLVDKTIGGTIRCLNATEKPFSCGHEEYCQNCQILSPALLALQGQKAMRNRVKVQLQIGKTVEDKEMLVTAAPIEYEGKRYAIILIEDITELSELRKLLTKQQVATKFIGFDPKIIELRENIKILSEVDVPVMIQGESGTGKELIARAIHEEGSRSAMPFIAVNCSALPETLLESELFGHVKGAFTGAIRDKKGRFELADEGTIFLDEIGDISPTMQVKLLRILQEETFERVGDEKTIHVNVRVISATNKDIRKEITAGRFREDLFYRLCVVPLLVPPLRERRDDIPLLAEHILKHTVIEGRQDPITFSPNALELLINYDWPGNVRELQNAIQYALVLCRGNVIEAQHILPNLSINHPLKSKRQRKTRERKLDPDMVKQALIKTKGNKVDTARLLGVSRSTLYRFLDEVEISI